MKSFAAAYLARHTGRSLTWCSALGGATLTWTGPERRHELSCGLCEATVLVHCFGTTDSCTMAEVLSTVGTGADVKNAVQRLIAGRVLAAGSTKTVTEGDVLSLRPQKARKICVRRGDGHSKRGGGAGAGGDDSDRTHARKPLAEACLVRIMKSRRTLRVADLLAQAMQQLAHRFKPEPQFLKVCISQEINAKQQTTETHRRPN